MLSDLIKNIKKQSETFAKYFDTGKGEGKDNDAAKAPTGTEASETETSDTSQAAPKTDSYEAARSATTAAIAKAMETRRAAIKKTAEIRRELDKKAEAEKKAATEKSEATPMAAEQKSTPSKGSAAKAALEAEKTRAEGTDKADSVHLDKTVKANDETAENKTKVKSAEASEKTENLTDTGKTTESEKTIKTDKAENGDGLESKLEDMNTEEQQLVREFLKNNNLPIPEDEQAKDKPKVTELSDLGNISDRKIADGEARLGSAVFNTELALNGAKLGGKSGERFVLDVKEHEREESKRIENGEKLTEREKFMQHPFRQTIKNTFVRTSASVPLLVAVVMLLNMTVGLSGIVFAVRGDNLLLSIIVIEILICLIPCLFYCRLKNPDYISVLKLRPSGPDRIYFTAIVTVSVISASTLIKIILAAFGKFVSEFDAYYSLIHFSSKDNFTYSIYVIIAFTIIPAICRQFLFSGVTFGSYRASGYGNVASAVFTSLLYAMFFFDFYRLPQYFILGVIFCFAVAISHSLLTPLIAAIAESVFGLYFDGFIVSLMNSDYNILIIFLVTVIFLVFATLTLSEAERITYNRGVRGEKTDFVREMTFSAAFEEMLLSPTLILCVLIFSLRLILKRFVI